MSTLGEVVGAYRPAQRTADLIWHDIRRWRMYQDEQGAIRFCKHLILTVTLFFVMAGSSRATAYLSCSGYYGIADLQSMVPLESKVITQAKEPEQCSVSIDSKHISIQGSQWITSMYEICQNTDQTLVFSPGCSKYLAPDAMHDSGTFNKVTGVLRYHMGDILYILQCHKVKKVID